MVAIFEDEVDGIERAALTVSLAKSLNAAAASGVKITKIIAVPKDGSLLSRATGQKWECEEKGDKMICEKVKS